MGEVDRPKAETEGADADPPPRLRRYSPQRFAGGRQRCSAGLMEKEISLRLSSSITIQLSKSRQGVLGVSKFLSEEWVQEVTSALSEHQGFNNALGDADLAIQFSTADAPDGEVDYYLSAGGGTAAVALGTLDDADVTVKQSYDTAVAISKGEMNVQTAFMTGKLKVSGNLAKLMMHQSVIQQWGAAVSELDVEY